MCDDAYAMLIKLATMPVANSLLHQPVYYMPDPVSQPATTTSSTLTTNQHDFGSPTSDVAMAPIELSSPPLPPPLPVAMGGAADIDAFYDNGEDEEKGFTNAEMVISYKKGVVEYILVDTNA